MYLETLNILKLVSKTVYLKRVSVNEPRSVYKPNIKDVYLQDIISSPEHLV